MGSPGRVDGPRPHLLVVDDDARIVSMVQRWFGVLGWRVEGAGSGPEGLARAMATMPDIVLLDVMLPGYGGLEVLRRFRPVASDVVVVVSTASDSALQRADAFAAGADAYLAKPYSLSGLEEQVVALHRHRCRTSRLAR